METKPLSQSQTIASALAARSSKVNGEGNKRWSAASGKGVAITATPEKGLSEAARSLATTGIGATGYIHERRERRHSSLAATDVEEAPDSAASATSYGVPHDTFIASLNLTAGELETLTRGNFLYIKPRAQGPDVPVNQRLRSSQPVTSMVAERKGTTKVARVHLNFDGCAANSSPPVAFFRRYPYSGTPEFYAYPNVYEMEVASHGEVDPADYYTVSSAGVTRFSAVRSDFTALPQWEREYRLYRSLRRIPVFARYREWKGFTVWRNAVVHGKRAKACGALTANLFLLNPHLRAALVRLRRLCSEVRDWTLFTAEPGVTYTLDAFVAAQGQRRLVISTWLTEFSADVRGLVRTACDGVLDGFLADNRIAPEHRMTFMERAALRAVCKRLRRFIKTADFLVRDTLVGLALDSASTLVRYVLPLPQDAPPHVVRTQLPPDASESDELGGTGGAAALLGGGMSSAVAGGGGGLYSASLAGMLHAMGGAAGGPGGIGSLRNPALAHAAGGSAGALRSGSPPASTAVPLLEITASFDPEDAVDLSGSGGGGRRGHGWRAGGGRNGGGARRASGPEEANCSTPAGDGPAAGAATGSGISPLLVDASEVGAPPIRLTPSLHTVKAALRTLLFEGMVVVSVPPRLLTHPDLAPYTRAAGEDAGGSGGGDGGSDGEDDKEDIDLTEAVTSHSAYKRLPLDMVAGVEDAFAAAGTFCEAFEPHISTFLHDSRILVAMAGPSYAADVAELPPEQFEHAIRAYRLQATQMAEVPSSADVGVVRLDSAGLKRSLLPLPRRCLEGLQARIPTVLCTLSDGLTDDVRRMHATLSSSPSEVPAFLAKSAELERSNDALPLFKERQTRIRALAELMAANGWPIADGVKARFKMLRDALSDLEGSQAAADGAHDEDAKRFARVIEAMLPAARRALATVRERLDDSVVGDVSAQPARVVRYLRDVAVKLGDVSDTVARLTGWQVTLKQELAVFDTLEDTALDLQAKSRLWEGVVEWCEMAAALAGTLVTAVDSEATAGRLAAFSALASASERALPGNAAVQRLRAGVQTYECLLPVIGNLRSPALAKRHWDALCLLLHVVPPPRPTSGSVTAVVTSTGLPGGFSARALIVSQAPSGEAGTGWSSAASVAPAIGAAAAAPASGPAPIAPALTVADLLAVDVTSPAVAGAIASITADARAQAHLDCLFSESVTGVWAALDLPLAPHRGSRDVCTLGDTRGLVAAVVSTSATLSSILASPQGAHLRSEAASFQKRIALFSETLAEWLGLQALWLRLETVFAGEEAQRQLSDEAKRYAAVDRSWRALMKKTGNNPNALSCGTSKGLRETLARHREALGEVDAAALHLLRDSAAEMSDALGRSKAAPEERARAAATIAPVLRMDVPAEMAAFRQRWGLQATHGAVKTSAAALFAAGDEVDHTVDGEAAVAAALLPFLLRGGAEEVRAHLRALASVTDDVPASLLLGLAYIHVGDVRAALVRIRVALAHGMMGHLLHAAAEVVRACPPRARARAVMTEPSVEELPPPVTKATRSRSGGGGSAEAADIADSAEPEVTPEQDIEAVEGADSAADADFASVDKEQGESAPLAAARAVFGLAEEAAMVLPWRYAMARHSLELMIKS